MNGMRKKKEKKDCTGDNPMRTALARLSCYAYFDPCFPQERNLTCLPLYVRSGNRKVLRTACPEVHRNFLVSYSGWVPLGKKIRLNCTGEGPQAT